MARKPMRRSCTFMGRGTRLLLGAGVADTGRADSMAPLARGADEMGGRGGGGGGGAAGWLAGRQDARSPSGTAGPA